MSKRDTLKKEIKELELQIKLKKKELRGLAREPGKRGGSWLLQNTQDWDKIFEEFHRVHLHNYETNNKSRTNTLKENSKDVFGFTETCEKHGYPGVSVWNIYNMKSIQIQELRNQFFIKWEKSIKYLIEKRKKIRDRLETEHLQLLEKEMEKLDGDYKKVIKNNRYLSHFHRRDPRIIKLRTQIRNKNWKEYKEECKKRYHDFRKLGLKPNDSLFLSGIGYPSGNQTKDFLNDEKGFHQTFLDDFQKDRDENYDVSKKTGEHLDQISEYIELIKSIKSSYKFEKGWGTGTGRKQWNLKPYHFVKPDYKRVFDDYSDTLLNRISKDYEYTKKKVLVNVKRGLLDENFKLIRDSKRDKVDTRTEKIKRKLSPYKYQTQKQVYNDGDFFIQLEKIMKRLSVLDYGYGRKDFKEQVGVSNNVWKSLITNQEFRNKYDMLLDKIRGEHLTKQLKSLDSKYSDVIVRSSENGKVFYNIKNEVVVMDCNFCGEMKSQEHFPIYSQKKNHYKCFSCIKGESGTSRPGEKMNGKIIKKYDSRGVVTHNRCTSCDEFKLKKEFKHKWRGSSVCDDCYVELPNNHLTRKGEFDSKGNRIRIYNSNFKVTHKRCKSCVEMKPLDEFYNSVNSKIDGRGGMCRSCITKSKTKKERTPM